MRHFTILSQRIVSCCRRILTIISHLDPHLVDTSPFNIFVSKSFCSWTTLKLCFRFQLYEKAETTFLHSESTWSMRWSFSPLFIAMSKL